MIRKLVCIVLVSICLAEKQSLVQAWSEKGEIQVIVEFEDDLIHECSVELYRVAEPSGKDYVLSEDFGGGLIKAEDISSSALACWLAESSEDEGLSRILDADGAACYSGLEDGLYLITQGEWDQPGSGFKPVLVSVPYLGSRIVGIKPQINQLLMESPKTGDHFSPLAGAMGIILSSLAVSACIEKMKRK